MGLFKKRATDPAEIERLKAEIAAMGARLEAADQRLAIADRRLDAADTVKTELGEQVRGIVTRLDTPIAPPPHEPPPSPPPPPAPAIDPAELSDVRHRLEELASRLDGIDLRITSISTELANQIVELSGEIEAASAGGAPPADELVEELRDAQTRLANEQARYQIAFRQDLAALADRLKRS